MIRFFYLLAFGLVLFFDPVCLADPTGPLLGAALSGDGPIAVARSLADGVGHRLAGGPADKKAVQWGLAAMKAAGLSNVRAEKVLVPHWDRGPRSREFAELVTPSAQQLLVSALGGSVGTGPSGLFAEVIAVESFEELAALPQDAVRGRIVLYQVVMQRGADGMANYREVAHYRGKGPSAAAKKGAVGVLLRSLGIAHYRLPHTGATRYEEGAPKIPAAALATEDADLLFRLIKQGVRPKVRLSLPCSTLPDAESANVIGEVPGTDPTLRKEILLLSAHLDSWDVGTGAIDDAAGVAIILTAARAMIRSGLLPKRTVRVVFFANEENGLRGAKTYAAVHKDELPFHVAALEADSGGGRPSGFLVRQKSQVPLLSAQVSGLAGIGASTVRVGDAGGADLTTLDQVVPVFQLIQDTSRYFEWHHTMADTADKLDPLDLGLCAGALAVATYGLATAREVLQRP